MILYDYLDARGVNVIKEWLGDLPKKERGKLQQRFDRIEKVADPVRELPRLPGLLVGPGIDGEKEIYKFQVGKSKAEYALRPLACRGPFDKNTEVTLLAGAVEKNFDLKPDGIAATAERHRQAILADRKRRRLHEPVA